MSEETTKSEFTWIDDNTIRDPKAFIKAHEELKADFKSLKQAHEELQAKIDATPVDNPWKNVALKAQTLVELSKRGIKNENLSKYINTADLDLDEEGNIAGLSERIESASTEFPEVFDPKRWVGGQADSFKSSPVNESKSVTDMQLDAIYNK